MSSESRVELTDAELARIATELSDIARGSSWSRALATGRLVLKHFFAGDVNEWRTHRRQKDASIRRLAQRPECPLGKSALSEAVTIYVAKKELPKVVEELTPSHVAIALRLAPTQCLALIDKAVAGAWSVRRMRSEALLLKRDAGERRGRPRFSQARSALSQLKAGLCALDAGVELLRVASDIDGDTQRRIEGAITALEQKLDEARTRISALAGPGLRSAPKASMVVPAKGRLAG